MRLTMSLIAAATAAFTVVPVHAQDYYTADDTRAAIAQASRTHGVPYWWLRNTVECETAGTFSPYSKGKLGEQGAAQLYPRGELRTFYARGYDDPWNPYEAIDFMAQRFSEGASGAWTCA